MYIFREFLSGYRYFSDDKEVFILDINDMNKNQASVQKQD